jgi:hypothetical protein
VTGKYRWRRRVCEDCESRLEAVGYVTISGMQVQSCMQAATAICGPVLRTGVDHPPTGSKWRTVPRLEGAIKRKYRGQWVDVEKEDIARMRRGESDYPRIVLAGAAISGATPCVSNSSEHNAFKALCCRVFRAPAHRPQPGAWDVARRFRRLLLPHLEAEIMTVEAWLQSVEPRRRTILTRCADDYALSGWKKKFQKFKAFVKSEKLPDFQKKHGELLPMTEMVDRLIQGPADTTHVIAGPVLKPLIAELKTQWGKDSKIFYAGTKLATLQAWLDDRLADGEFFSFASDYSMFDNSHSEESWAFMEEIYRKAGCFKHKDFGKVMDAWRAPKGSLAGKRWALKYQGPTMNASGRDDTSLANGVLNGFAAFLAATAAWYQVNLVDLTEAHVLGVPLKLAVAGDDSLGFLPTLSPERMRQFQLDFSAALARFGFDAGPEKIITTTRPIDLVFLGMRPYPVGGKWYWGKTIGRALFKQGWTLKVASNWAAWFAGECEQILATCQHIPVLSDIAWAFLRQHEGGKVTKKHQEAWRWEIEHQPWKEGHRCPPYDDSTIAAVADLYGTTTTALKALIGVLRGLKTFPCVLSDPLLRTMIYQDDQ